MREDYTYALERDMNALVAACLEDPEARVSACPDWDNAALLNHLIQVWLFANAQVKATNPEKPTRPEIIEGLNDLDLKAKAHIASSNLYESLALCDPTQPAWNWSPDLTCAFWLRRMAHETAIHRWDAETAIGKEAGLDPELSLDTVAEVVEVMMQFQFSGPITEFPSGSLHLHCTDADGEWLLTSSGSDLVVTNEHAKADVAARGEAANLALWLWNRGDAGVEFFGDEELLRSWASLAP